MQFWSFKNTIHAYLLKISKIHYKKRIALLNLLINCIAARSSAPLRLPIKDECTFRFSISFIIDLCSSLANSWVEKILFLIADLFCPSTVSDQACVTAPSEALAQKTFSQKSYKKLRQDRFDIHHISGFYQH